MCHAREKSKSAAGMVLRGDYGGASGKAQRKKDGCYKDSGGNKVRDKNVITAAEYYIERGMYVVFLHEYYSRPDLLVDFNFLAEVKGIGSDKSGTISKQIKHASRQIDNELAHSSEDDQLPAKIILISLHESFEVGFKAVYEGYQEAKRKNQVHFKVEFWFNGEITVLEEE